MFLRLSFAVHILWRSRRAHSSWKIGKRNLLKTTCKQAEANGKSERLRNNERSCSCMKMGKLFHHQLRASRKKKVEKAKKIDNCSSLWLGIMNEQMQKQKLSSGQLSPISVIKVSLLSPGSASKTEITSRMKFELISDDTFSVSVLNSSFVCGL